MTRKHTDTVAEWLALLGIVACGAAMISGAVLLVLMMIVGAVLLVSTPLAFVLWICWSVSGLGALFASLPAELQAPSFWNVLMFCAVWVVLSGSLRAMVRRKIRQLLSTSTAA